nr:MAG TPA: hypothetical protein [Caudoviricetes sp.]
MFVHFDPAGAADLSRSAPQLYTICTIKQKNRPRRQPGTAFDR